MSGISLIEHVEFWLDGDIVRVRTKSGTDYATFCLPIGMFVHQHTLATEIIALWRSKCCQVVPIGKRKRRPRHHAAAD